MRTIRRVLGLVVVAILAACDQGPAEQQLRLPNGMVAAGRDPYHQAVLELEFRLLSQPQALRGNVGEVARMAAWFEVLTNRMANLPEPDDAANRPRMREARELLRQSLGFAPEAPPQAILDGLWAVVRASETGAPVEPLLAPPLGAVRAPDMRDRFERFVPDPRLGEAVRGVVDSLRRRR